MANGLLKELREVKPADAELVPTRDVRARKPPAWRLLLRFDLLRRLARVLVLATFDIAAVFLAIWTALELKAILLGQPDLSKSLEGAIDFSPLACLVTLLLFARSGLYAPRAVRPGFARIVSSLFQVTLVILVYAVVEGERFSSYYIFYGSLLFALAYVSAFRYGFEKVTGALLRAAGYHRRAVLVGSGSQIEAVAHALRSGQPEVEPVGFVSLAPIKAGNGLKDLGPLHRIEEYFGQIDEVLITDPDFPQEHAVELVDRCHSHGVRVCVAPSTMEILMDRVEFVPGQTLPLFELKPPVFEGMDFALKRGFDLVVSTLLVLFLAPLLALIALAVRLNSPGPVIYRSMRPGIGGKPFACLKFRTMFQDADVRQLELEQRNEKGGAIFKIRDDPRVTRVGRFLRRWSLDELPQLVVVAAAHRRRRGQAAATRRRAPGRRPGWS